MAKDFNGSTSGLGGIPTDALAITPNDGANLSQTVQFLMVGADGDVKVDMHDGTTVTLPGLKAGVQYWGLVKKVHATGTTATNIVGLF